jgi:hypothetical protein
MCRHIKAEISAKELLTYKNVYFVDGNVMPLLSLRYVSIISKRNFTWKLYICMTSWPWLYSNVNQKYVHNSGNSKTKWFMFLLTSTGRGYVSELRPPTGLLFIPQKIHEHGEQRWNDIERGRPKNSGKTPVPVSLCPPQIPHGLTQARIWASAVRGRRLTAQATACPSQAVKIYGKNLRLLRATHLGEIENGLAWTALPGVGSIMTRAVLFGSPSQNSAFQKHVSSLLVLSSVLEPCCFVRRCIDLRNHTAPKPKTTPPLY